MGALLGWALVLQANEMTGDISFVLAARPRQTAASRPKTSQRQRQSLVSPSS